MPTANLPGEGDVIAAEEFTLLSSITPFLDLLVPVMIPIGISMIAMGPENAVNALKDAAKHATKYFSPPITFLYKDIIDGTMAPIVQGMLEDGIGINVSNFDDDGHKALTVIDGLVGFATALTLGVSALHAPLKLLLGQRIGDAVFEAIARIPEEMGLSWALGIVISDTFKAALGTALERNIWRIKRPNEPEWPIARQLVRQHVLDPKDFITLMENAGYSDDWIKKLERLETVPLPLGDIQTLYYHKEIDDKQLIELLNALGFTDGNRDYLKTIYIDKAETTSGAILRSIARTLFLDFLMDEATYRDILDKTHFPAMLIDDDIEAVKLEHSARALAGPIAHEKQLYNRGSITQSTAINQLVVLGLSQEQATELVSGWTGQLPPRTHGLTEAQVLKYYIAGLKNPQDTRALLTSLGIDHDTVEFLLQNPTSAIGVRVVKPTPSLVIEAFLSGAIDHSGLEEAFKKAGVHDDTMSYWMARANYAYNHHHVPNSGTTMLAEGKILEAFKYNLMDQPSATSALMLHGYSADNATLLLEIENKGPIRPPQMNPFASVQDAITFLEDDGYFVGPGPDPRIAIAEAMVTAAGYIVTPPHEFPVPIPPVPPIPGKP